MIRRGWPRVLVWSAAFLLAHVTTVWAQATDAARSETSPLVRIRWSLKGGVLLSRAPGAPEVFANRASATAFGRARIEPTIGLGRRASFDLAYEQRVRLTSAASASRGLVAGALPAVAPAPYRLTQLDWQIAAGANGIWRQEIDRAALHVRTSRLTLAAGRQAVGWGRGVLFGAIDLFAPFSPLEADREWRRGVDAVTADVRVADRISIGGIGAFDRRVEGSAFGARLRGYAGDVDVEVVGGRRARDVFGGVASSAAVGPAELHGELAVFRVPAAPGSAVVDGDRTIVKAVAGGSYRVPLGAGVLVYVEYHYSGFGARSAGDIVAALADPAFARRFVRGDTQILTRHALAALASYAYSPLTSFAAMWIQQPVDRSGVIGPTVTFTFGDRLSLVATGYVSYGRRSSGTGLGSEYGAAPRSVFVETRFYR